MRNHVGLALTAIFFSVALCWSQPRQASPPNPAPTSPSDSTPTTLTADQKAKIQAERVRQAFQKLKDDSDKLVLGSAELKQMIQKSNAHTYSLGIIKKAEELEKLARKIKNRAKRGFD